MSFDKIAIAFTGIIVIIFIYWFFLAKKEKKTNIAAKEVDILVSGGYQPESIVISTGQTFKLNFLRKDDNSCLEEVVLADFKVKKYLPLNQKVTVEIKPTKPGEFVYSCGMGMFHGKIIVQ